MAKLIKTGHKSSSQTIVQKRVFMCLHLSTDVSLIVDAWAFLYTKACVFLRKYIKANLHESQCVGIGT